MSAAAIIYYYSMISSNSKLGCLGMMIKAVFSAINPVTSTILAFNFSITSHPQFLSTQLHGSGLIVDSASWICTLAAEFHNNLPVVECVTHPGPISTALSCVHPCHTSDLQDFMLDCILDVYDPVSPRAVMWSTAPRPHELRHLLNIPAQYLPLLQHPQLVSSHHKQRCAQQCSSTTQCKDAATKHNIYCTYSHSC